MPREEIPGKKWQDETYEESLKKEEVNKKKSRYSPDDNRDDSNDESGWE